MTEPFDWTDVRRHFPGLAGEWTFFDNAGGSQILGRVADRVRDHFLGCNVQLGATYEPSARATENVAAATAALAEQIGAASAEEVVLGSSSTQLLKNLARAMAPGLSEGDEIVVSRSEHETNVSPWVALERERGVTVRWWPVDPESLRLRTEDLAPLLGDRTRLVAFTHASNVLGTINPVAEITRLVHEHGAKVCVDGVAWAPHRAVEVNAWDVDYYVFSLYKVYGPHISLLYGKREHLEALAPINHFFIGPDQCPYHLQPGGPNHELAWGAGGIPDYLAELSVALGGPASGHAAARAAFAGIAELEERLAERFLAWANGRPDIRVIGETTPSREVRVPTFSFVAGERKSSEVPPLVDPHRIGIRWGDFYAARLIDDLGLRARDGVVRVSMVHYNTLDEVDRLVAVLDEVL